MSAPEAAPASVGGALQSYTFTMAEDPVSVVLAGEGELAVSVHLESVTTQGDSQAVLLRIRNPHSLQMRALNFDVTWRTRDGREERREVEWSGQVDPGYAAEVTFAVGPVAASDLSAITISGVRSRWAGRRSD
jgi:hypothetical protein